MSKNKKFIRVKGIKDDVKLHDRICLNCNKSYISKEQQSPRKCPSCGSENTKQMLKGI